MVDIHEGGHEARLGDAYEIGSDKAIPSLVTQQHTLASGERRQKKIAPAIPVEIAERRAKKDIISYNG